MRELELAFDGTKTLFENWRYHYDVVETLIEM